MRIELINTGSELMLGRVLNTHQQWLCQQLADRGYIVSRQMAVNDNAQDIVEAVSESLRRADLVITTGGLGPTSDDLTRDALTGLLEMKLREDPEVLGRIRKFFSMRNRPMPETTRVQAQVPEGALVLQNEHGTAPGLAVRVNPNRFREGGAASWLIMLPGPPRELRPMFADAVVPLLRRELPTESAFVCSNLRTTGTGESLVQERIAPPLAPLVTQGLEVGYCARPGQVDVRLAARGPQAAGLVGQAEAIARAELGDKIFGSGDEELAAVIARLLTERKQTLALAESCTGGHIANQLTDVPGASAFFLTGWVTYSNEAKRKCLGVSSESLQAHGAVSRQVALEMAEGARREAGADYALSITGIAGPTGGTADKPAGTVFIGLAGPGQSAVEQYMNPYDRLTFKQVTTQQALELLRRRILLRNELRESPV